jgi:hypothetical protein
VSFPNVLIGNVPVEDGQSATNPYNRNSNDIISKKPNEVEALSQENQNTFHNTTKELLKSESSHTSSHGNEIPIDSPVESFDSTTVPSSINEAKPIVKEKTSKPWRVSAGFAPQFASESVRPTNNDDILVTSISNKGQAYQRIGYTIFLGGGKEVRRNLYLDAQLSYQRVNEQISFAYSTGQVDTLIASQQSDGMVRVMPVYHVTDAEQTLHISLAGLRVGGTFYFWQRGMRRFNIGASAGINSVLSSKKETKTDTSISSSRIDGLNKFSYSLSISGGYSIAFAPGWEAMINPTLTYFVRTGAPKNQVINFSQRSYGLQVSLSKTIR